MAAVGRGTAGSREEALASQRDKVPLSTSPSPARGPTSCVHPLQRAGQHVTGAAWSVDGGGGALIV